jgi:DNA modification methylase
MRAKLKSFEEPKGFSTVKKIIAPKINKEIDDLQLAFFHPYFQWKGKESFIHRGNKGKVMNPIRDRSNERALNYEKRAPFPTINILRSGKIKAYANEVMLKLLRTIACFLIVMYGVVGKISTNR